VAERYPDMSFEWFYWSKQYDRGDAKAAEAVIQARIRQLGDPPPPGQQERMASYYLLTKQHDKALATLNALCGPRAPDMMLLLLAMSQDRLGRAKERDPTLRRAAALRTTGGKLAQLFLDAVADGDKGQLDLRAVDALLNGMPADLRGDTWYFVGRFLDGRGQAEAVKYYARCAEAPLHKTATIHILALVELRNHGQQPGKAQAD
jgi:hypothetical protein